LRAEPLRRFKTSSLANVCGDGDRVAFGDEGIDPELRRGERAKIVLYVVFLVCETWGASARAKRSREPAAFAFASRAESFGEGERHCGFSAFEFFSLSTFIFAKEVSFLPRANGGETGGFERG
jgi:hypothetical protein|tara:strand:- start:35795 stop:36163 length:369 start_codon:yes stop_codon:yes gene_type:complete